MPKKGPTFQEKSARGECFTLGCDRKVVTKIRFKGVEVNACEGHRYADGMFEP